MGKSTDNSSILSLSLFSVLGQTGVTWNTIKASNVFFIFLTHFEISTVSPLGFCLSLPKWPKVRSSSDAQVTAGEHFPESSPSVPPCPPLTPHPPISPLTPSHPPPCPIPSLPPSRAASSYFFYFYEQCWISMRTSKSGSIFLIFTEPNHFNVTRANSHNIQCKKIFYA